MKRMNYVLLVLLLVINVFIVHRAKALGEQTKICRVIARVLESNDTRFHPGDGVCFGDSTVFRGKVLLACTQSGVSAFETISASEASRCVLKEAQTSKGRGEDKSKKPFLIEPVGSSLSKQLGKLLWKGVGGAEYYRITLVGSFHFNQWEVTTKKTEIVLPKLKLEPTTQVLIEAISQEKVISYSETTFNFLNPEQLSRLNYNFELIKSYQISEIEKNYLTVSLYKRYGLLEDSLDYVEGKLKINSEDARLKKLLIAIKREANLQEEST